MKSKNLPHIASESRNRNISQMTIDQVNSQRLQFASARAAQVPSFKPTKRHHTIEYQDARPASKSNIYKFVKNEPLKRVRHLEEDISSHVSPYFSPKLKTVISVSRAERDRLNLSRLLTDLSGNPNATAKHITTQKTKKQNSEQQPLYYNGQKVATFLELKELVSLDSFETVIHDYMQTKKAEEEGLPEKDRDPVTKIDDEYLSLINKARPFG